MGVNTLLIGGGGREHAIALALARSPRLGTLFVSHPENPGLAALGRPVGVPIDARAPFQLQRFCDRNDIGLVVIGPEDYLADGLADLLAAPGRAIFGPNREAARLESDKAWAKHLMRSASIPTAEARIFTDPEAARQYIESRIPEDQVLGRAFMEARAIRDPQQRRAFLTQRATQDRALAAALSLERPDLPVVKAAGLAKGKGVIVPATVADAMAAIDRIMVRREFGDAGRTILIEERLTGREVSVFALVDGRTIYILETAQDHKRLGDGDTGPNTGGMGAFSPSPAIDDALMAQIQREILVPTVDALKRDGVDFRGVLYAGLMLTPAGPKVLEYNARFGDPECQALLPRLRTDLLELLLATSERRLDRAEIEWIPGASCCIVLASEGYPESPKKGALIEGLDHAASIPGITITHAGTTLDAAGRVITAGGRVLGITAVGADLAQARERAYHAADLVRFHGMQMRRDIGLPAPNHGGDGSVRGTTVRSHSSALEPAPGGYIR